MITNALTVDVEDYFQVSAFRDQVSPDDWPQFESRVVANTHRVLDVFDDAGATATFFVLGWIAEHHPQLVRDIAARGHEIACHGYSHQLIYGQSQAVFRRRNAARKEPCSKTRRSSPCTVIAQRAFRSPMRRVGRSMCWPTAASNTTRACIRCVTICTERQSSRQVRIESSRPPARR